MNIIDWFNEDLDHRTLWRTCFINVNGESHSCEIRQKEQQVTIKWKDDQVEHELVAQLEEISLFPSNSTLFMVNVRWPEPTAATLLIPHSGRSVGSRK